MHATISKPFPQLCTTPAAEVKHLRHFTKCPTDMTNYHLGAGVPEDDTQSLKMHLDDYPSSLLDELGLCPFLQQPTRPGR